MNKKHREAFRELRDWCEKWNAMILCKNADMAITIGDEPYYVNGLFEEKTELVMQLQDPVNHSISSEQEVE